MGWGGGLSRCEEALPTDALSCPQSLSFSLSLSFTKSFMLTPSIHVRVCCPFFILSRSHSLAHSLSHPIDSCPCPVRCGGVSVESLAAPVLPASVQHHPHNGQHAQAHHGNHEGKEASNRTHALLLYLHCTHRNTQALYFSMWWTTLYHQLGL